MANQNVTVVRRFMRRFLEQDVDGALEDVHPDAKLDWSSSDAPDSGVYTGHAAWRAFAGARDEVLAGRGFEFAELVASGPDEVVLVGRMRERGRTSGIEVQAQGSAVFTLREGKIARLKLYRTSEQALKAVGLTP